MASRPSIDLVRNFSLDRESTFHGNCLVCLSAEPQKDKVSKPKEESVQKLLDCIRERASYDNAQYRNLQRMLQDENSQSLITNGCFYHRKCYQTATKVDHIKRDRAKFLTRTTVCPDEPTEQQTAFSRNTRSLVPIFDREQCIIFSIEPRGRKGLHNIETKNMDQKLRRTVEQRGDDEMQIRINSASDATAAEIKYHLQCWVK